MKSRILFELETLRDILKASIEALEEIERSPSGLTRYDRGYRDSRRDVLTIVERILKEVSE